MYRQIIIGYDGSPQADDALAIGKQLASATGASLTAVTVLERARRLEHVGEAASVATKTVEASSPARGLHEYAERGDVDLVVLGSAHYGKVGQILAGSVAMSLLHGSPCAIAIAPLGYADRASAGIEEVAVGYDAQRESRAALADAIELARSTVAPLKIVTVVVPPPVIGYGIGGGPVQDWNELKNTARAAMRERLDEAVASAPDDVRVEPVLAEGDDPARELARVAVADGGILVVGSRAHGPVRRVLLGSVSTALVRSAHCPLIVHPRPAKPDLDEMAPNQAAGAV
jgi:nucleotide-binding universal stress UspA family protein